MKYETPADCPYYLITRASLSATAVLKKELTDSGLPEVKPAYLGVLMCLWTGEGLDEMLSKLGSEDGMRLTDLSRCAGLEPSTMTGLIDRMERDGLVQRSSDPHDRRSLKVTLTEKGGMIRDKVFEAVDRMLQEAFAGIQPGELEITRKVLRKVLTNANKGMM
ncbi:MAG: MarR family winged helix-turn-helix transcriptional regulator [Thermodesulfobacteriota bacterium]